MKKILILYHAPEDIIQENMANSTPEEQTKGVENWIIWAKSCGDKLVDLGSPLTSGVRLEPGNQSSAKNKEVVGYSILQANNIEEAKSLLVEHPHLNWSSACSIEIHESMPTPGL